MYLLANNSKWLPVLRCNSRTVAFLLWSMVKTNQLERNILYLLFLDTAVTVHNTYKMYHKENAIQVQSLPLR